MDNDKVQKELSWLRKRRVFYVAFILLSAFAAWRDHEARVVLYFLMVFYAMLGALTDIAYWQLLDKTET